MITTAGGLRSSFESDGLAGIRDAATLTSPYTRRFYVCQDACNPLQVVDSHCHPKPIFDAWGIASWHQLVSGSRFEYRSHRPASHSHLGSIAIDRDLSRGAIFREARPIARREARRFGTVVL